LNNYLIIGDTVYKALLEKAVGCILGPVLILIGFWRWFPLVATLRKAEQDLKRANQKLEILVEVRTAELERANGQLRQEIEEHTRAEESLRKSEAKNQALLNAIPDMMFRINQDGTFLEFKAAKGLEPLLPPAEFLGKTVSEVMPPELTQQIMHYLERALQSDDTQIFEYQLPLKDEMRHYEGRLVASGVQADEVLAIVRDITERKRREAMVEAERARIARGLHDGLAQSLYLLGLKLDYRRKQGSRAPESVTGEPDALPETVQTDLPLQDETIETPDITPLTELELDILRLVAQGLPNSDIGVQLGLAEKTVGNRLTVIFNKLHVNNRVQATLYALRQGLVNLEGGVFDSFQG
jgi:PAS domain S-box-containing protein